jgi:hypothetical protein
METLTPFGSNEDETVQPKHIWYQRKDFLSTRSSTAGNGTNGNASKYFNNGHTQNKLTIIEGEMDTETTVTGGKGGRVKLQNGEVIKCSNHFCSIISCMVILYLSIWLLLPTACG